jgi:hypothetical protein
MIKNIGIDGSIKEKAGITLNPQGAVRLHDTTPKTRYSL